MNSSPADKRSPIYDQTKAESNKIVLEAVKEGLDAVIIAPTGIIGPNDFKLSRMGAVLIKLYKQKLFGLDDGEPHTSRSCQSQLVSQEFSGLS